MISRISQLTDALTVRIMWTFCCKGSFCSLTAQQNEGLKRIKRHLYVELLVKDKVRNSMLLFLTCRLKSKYYKQNLVLACSHRAAGWAVGGGYASGKVLSLPSSGEVAQSRLTHAARGCILLCWQPDTRLALQVPGPLVLIHGCSLTP